MRTTTAIVIVGLVIANLWHAFPRTKLNEHIHTHIHTRNVSVTIALSALTRNSNACVRLVQVAECCRGAKYSTLHPPHTQCAPMVNMSVIFRPLWNLHVSCTTCPVESRLFALRSPDDVTATGRAYRTVRMASFPSSLCCSTNATDVRPKCTTTTSGIWTENVCVRNMETTEPEDRKLLPAIVVGIKPGMLGNLGLERRVCV